MVHIAFIDIIQDHTKQFNSNVVCFRQLHKILFREIMKFKTLRNLYMLLRYTAACFQLKLFATYIQFFTGNCNKIGCIPIYLQLWFDEFVSITTVYLVAFHMCRFMCITVPLTNFLNAF